MQPTMFICLGITLFYYSTVNFYLQLQTLHLIPDLVNNVAYVCTLLKVWSVSNLICAATPNNMQ